MYIISLCSLIRECFSTDFTWNERDGGFVLAFIFMFSFVQWSLVKKGKGQRAEGFFENAEAGFWEVFLVS